MAYSHTTLNQAITALSARLYGSGMYTTAELTSYIIESIRTWNAYTGFHRGSFVKALTANIHWYDLTTLAGTLRPITLTDNTILSQINYHLLEPQIAAYPLVWSGSTQFAVSDILNAIQRGRDESLALSGCHVTRTLYPAVPGVITLNDLAIDIRRVAWIPNAGFGYTTRTLRSSDPWAKRTGDYNYTTAPARPPSVYIQSTEPPLTFSVDSVPPCPGQYEVLTVDAGATLSTAAATSLGVPDDLSWVVKFGALADLLSRDSVAKDTVRSQYADYRYREGIALMNLSPALTDLRINNIPLAIDALRNGDDFNSTWQAVVAGTPKSAYSAGLNLLAFSPKPDSSVAYSVTFSCVRNAQVPVNGADFIQVGRETIDLILDYAQHLASFKLGGAEFTSTIELYSQFVKAAVLYNSKLSELGQYQKAIFDLSRLNSERAPVYSSATPLSMVESDAQ